MASILIIEDESALNDLIRTELEAEGHVVRQTRDGRTALQMVEEQTPQLVILDWMLPGLDGLSVCRQLREKHLMPIIMLTARSEEVDRVLGLGVGADDYLVKPFGLRELLARVRAMLRRVDLEGVRRAPTIDGKVQSGALTIDINSRITTLDGAPMHLTRKEFELLTVLVSNP